MELSYMELSYRELRERVLSGYAYEIRSSIEKVRKEGERNVVLHTGQGGVLSYIKECEKGRVPAIWVADTITCYTDFGAYPLSILSVKKVEIEDQLIK